MKKELSKYLVVKMIEYIKDTDDWELQGEDLDSTLCRGIMHLEEYMDGKKWV